MVLFNNPVDKQQILTLSRQMYPENPQHLLRHFKEATSKPYGYLLIDLKLTTPENLRMRTNIMNTIKPKSTERLDHFRESRPNIQTCEELSMNQSENPSRLEQPLRGFITYRSNRKKCRPVTIAD